MCKSWNVEVDVLLVDFTIELVFRFEWRNFTMFVRSMLFFHCVCSWAVTLIRLPWSIASLLNTVFFSDKLRASIALSVISGCPEPSEAQSFPWKPFSSISWEQDVSPSTTIIPLRVLRLPWSITDWIWAWLGWLGERFVLNLFSRLSNYLTFWLLINCRTLLNFPSGPIVIVS